MRRRKGVYLDCDKTVKLVACDEIHLGDQRWIHRQHGVYQEAVDEAPMVCPYSNSKRSRTLTPISAAPQLHPRTVSYKLRCVGPRFIARSLVTQSVVLDSLIHHINDSHRLLMISFTPLSS
jgi:hypothetical protein